MAQPSKLDQTERAGARFNNAADSAMEKRLQSHQLNPDERQQVTDLRKDCENKRDQEVQAFAKPGVKNERRDEKYAEIAQRNNHPTPEHFPPGMRNRTLSPGQMRCLADEGIKQDHANKLRGFDADYRNSVNTILKKAHEQGRGPGPEQDRSRDQNRALAPSQDFNRAGNDNQNGQGRPEQTSQRDFNRAADRDDR